MRPILRLTRTQQQIYDLVRRRPRTTDQLHWLLWQLYAAADTPQRACVKAHVYWLNCKLCYCGERVTAKRFEPYRIVRIHPHGHPKRQPALNPNAAGVEGA